MDINGACNRFQIEVTAKRATLMERYTVFNENSDSNYLSVETVPQAL